MRFYKQAPPTQKAGIPTAALQQSTFFKSARLLAATALLMLAACEKEPHHHDDTDTVAPALSINSPSQMQVFNQGDTLYIQGSLSDASLHELSITLRDDKDSSLLFSATPVVHGLSTYTLNSFWVCNVKDHTNATLRITAHDHSENKTEVLRAIHIMP
ncbi:MAG: hypothetical protein ACK5DE_08340 [Bacteroidota bacterium]|jgi:hypothetical protein